MAIREAHITKPEIDLNGPQGNAFFLLGTALSLGRRLGYTEEQIKAITDDMKSSNYEHLIQTFDKHFGDEVDLVR